MLGFATYLRYRKNFNVVVNGLNHLEHLPKHGVLFVANHETYFAEVILFYHILCGWRNGIQEPLKNPFKYLLKPFYRFYYIAAMETMKKGLIPKIFAYTGSVSIKRTWREAGKDINRQVDMRDISNIGKALDSGWVMTFPQGTTKPFAKGRRGTSHLIQKYNPAVVPIVVSGFRESFDKKGFKILKKGSVLQFQIKSPLVFSENQSADQILGKVMDAIEQSEKFYPVGNK